MGLVLIHTMTRDDLLDLLERSVVKTGLSARSISENGGVDPNVIKNMRRHRSTGKPTVPNFENLQSLCRALGLEFYIGPPRGSAPAESAPPAWTSFAETTAPHRGFAKCSIQGWGKPQPERDPLPTPEVAMDQDTFWLSVTGQSMIPEGIRSSAFCLVAPGTQAREGDRVWVLDHEGKAAIKRLVAKRENGGLGLRGWMPVRDGQQKDFVEERFAAGLREVYPVIAVFEGKPGSETCSYIPDPRPPAHAVPPAPERIPGAITGLPGLPEGAAVEKVVAAIQAQLASRGTAHATPAAALDRRTLERTLKAQTKALREEMAATLDARLPPVESAPGRAEVTSGESAALVSNSPASVEALSGDRAAPALVPVPFMRDVQAAAGAGVDVFNEATDMQVLVPTDGLPRPVRTDNLVALRSIGTSMEPTLRSGDTLVLDHTSAEPLEGRLFVLRTLTGLVVKRLRQEAGAWIMASDNPDFPPRAMAGEDRILGRVLWFGPEKAAVAGG